MANLKLELGDFLDIKRRHARTIIIRTGEVKKLLKVKIKQLAVKRCQDWRRQERRAQMADIRLEILPKVLSCSQFALLPSFLMSVELL